MTRRWKSCDERKFDNNFPPEKQFLITERVPCMKRIAEVESAASAIQEVELENGWFEARPPEDGETNQVVDIDDQMQVVDDIDAPAQQQPAADGADDEVVDMDDDIADMDADMAAEEQNPTAPVEAATDNIFEEEEFKQEENTAIKRVRMYDLSITYDYYHRTPRLWL